VEIDMDTQNHSLRMTIAMSAVFWRISRSSVALLIALLVIIMGTQGARAVPVEPGTDVPAEADSSLAQPFRLFMPNVSMDGSLSADGGPVSAADVVPCSSESLHQWAYPWNSSFQVNLTNGSDTSSLTVPVAN
jgi:hypothetical protein